MNIVQCKSVHRPYITDPKMKQKNSKGTESKAGKKKQSAMNEPDEI